MKKILLLSLMIILSSTMYCTNVNAVSSHPENIIQSTDMCEDFSDGYNWYYNSCSYHASEYDSLYLSYDILGTNATASIKLYSASYSLIETIPLSAGENNITSTQNWNYFKIYFHYEDPTFLMTERIKNSLYIGPVNPSLDVSPPEFSNAGVYYVSVDNPVLESEIQTTLSATDDTDGDVSNTITLVSDQYTGNQNTLGDYTIRYSAADSSGNTSYIDITVRVVDITSPSINLNGDSIITVPYQSTYLDLGAYSTDNYYSSESITTTSNVDTSVLGEYTLIYEYTDPSGNIATPIERTVIVVDNQAPVISLNGESVMYIEYLSTYNEPGATMIDNYDTSGTVSISGTVNTSILGEYTIEYTFSDSNQNNATPVQRTIVVQDTTSPVVTLQGETTMYIEYNTAFEDPGATYTDAYEGSGMAIASGTVDSLTLGEYTISYSYTDASGNVSNTVTRTVIVQDTISPIIEGVEEIIVYNSQGTTINEILSNITATDEVDGDISNQIIIVNDYYSGNEYLTGTYTFEIKVIDQNGNITTATGTVLVLDDRRPEFHVSNYLLSPEVANQMTQEEIKNHILNR